MNALLVVSRTDAADNFKSCLADPAIETCFICPIAYGLDKTVQEIMGLAQKAGKNAGVVEYLKEFNQNAFLFRDDYLKFIFELGQRTVGGVSLREYFVYPGENFSLWWFSLVNEKGPHKTESFTAFIQALTIARLKKKLNCGSLIMPRPAAQGTLKIFAVEYLKTVKLCLILLKRSIELRLCGLVDPAQRKKDLSASEIVAVTSFPFIDKEKVNSGEFVNKAYGALQKPLEEKYPQKITWLAMFASFDSLTWSDAVSFVAQLRKKGQKIFLLDEWLSPADFFGIGIRWMSVVFKFFAGFGRFKKAFVFSHPDIEGTIDVWPILKHDFCTSFMGKVLYYGIVYYETFKRVVVEIKPGAKVLHYAEMHVWEKALNAACRNRPDLTTVGLQHSIVPVLLLNNFNHPLELQGEDFVRRVPMPRRLGCVGTITRDIFLKNGWKKEDVFILGGFRYQSLVKMNGTLPHSEPKRKDQIVVAFSLSPFENIEMIRMLYDAYNDGKTGCKILLKGHPCDPLEETVKGLGLNLNPQVFEFTKTDLQKIVPESKAMIVKESSSCFWAIKNEIPVIIPNLFSIVDLCPLSKISTVPLFVNSAKELRELSNKIMAGEQLVDKQKYATLLDDYLEIYKDVSQYAENLEKCANSSAVRSQQSAV